METAESMVISFIRYQDLSRYGNRTGRSLAKNRVALGLTLHFRCWGALSYLEELTTQYLSKILYLKEEDFVRYSLVLTQVCWGGDGLVGMMSSAFEVL